MVGIMGNGVKTRISILIMTYTSVQATIFFLLSSFEKLVFAFANLETTLTNN